ncbi:MAG: hypothetical protein HYS05_20050 [Acidobacteria bacterium]|nr:hypothetical protein [Acidobacteriota bacterium]
MTGVTRAWRTRIGIALLILGFSGLPGSGTVAAPDAPALAAILRSELDRNFQALKTQPVAPYFLSYTVHDIHSASVEASFGSLGSSSESRDRILAVDLRVGGYELDNTHPMRGGMMGGAFLFNRASLPLTDDELALKTTIWRVTDRRFKQAVEQLTRVRTNVATKVAEENPAPDFSRELPEKYEGPAVSLTVDRRPWEERLRRVSAPFADDPLVYRGDARLTIEAESRYFVNSEGADIRSGQVRWRIFISAMTKADDGMELPLYQSYFAQSAAGLPTEAQLVSDVRKMVATLKQLRAAPLVDPFTGPAILSGRAAGVFFHETFGHRIEAHRQKRAEDAQTFAKKINQGVMPAFITVVFDPTLREASGTELVGHYLYDDEGVKARPVTVVDHGLLKNFLLSRSPLADVPRSNGHGRAQAGYLPVSRQSNLIVKSEHMVADADLVRLLKEEINKQGRPFGLLFENIEGGFTFTGRTVPNAFNVLPNLVYRVYPDDRPPELIRGVDLIGTPLSALERILASGTRPDTFNGVCGAESGGVPVSASSPALLIGQVEVQKKAKSQETKPILGAPEKSKKKT